jgi:hypothetical protein
LGFKLITRVRIDSVHRQPVLIVGNFPQILALPTRHGRLRPTAHSLFCHSPQNVLAVRHVGQQTTQFLSDHDVALARTSRLKITALAILPPSRQRRLLKGSFKGPPTDNRPAQSPMGMAPSTK